jgi:alpha-tubulin suppressor-like RCC1 family protein
MILGKTETMIQIPTIAIITERVISIASGGFHNMVTTKSGVIFAWGQGTFGQLGLVSLNIKL